MINSSVGLQTVINSIQNLSPEEQKLLLQQLQYPQLTSQQSTEKVDEDNPWIKLAGKYETDPTYDEVLAYIEEYRHQLDSEN
jgi:hypothetical protein